MPAATATNNHPGTAVHDGHHSEDMKGVAQMMVRDTLQNQEEMRNSNSNNSNNALGSGEETCSPQQHKKHNTESHISLAEGQHLESITEEALVDQALGI